MKEKLICGKCGYYDKDISRCIHEGIKLNPRSKICVCFFPKR